MCRNPGGLRLSIALAARELEASNGVLVELDSHPANPVDPFRAVYPLDVGGAGDRGLVCRVRAAELCRPLDTPLVARRELQPRFFPGERDPDIRGRDPNFLTVVSNLACDLRLEARTTSEERGDPPLARLNRLIGRGVRDLFELEFPLCELETPTFLNQAQFAGQDRESLADGVRNHVRLRHFLPPR